MAYDGSNGIENFCYREPLLMVAVYHVSGLWDGKRIGKQSDYDNSD